MFVKIDYEGAHLFMKIVLEGVNPVRTYILIKQLFTLRNTLQMKGVLTG